MATSGFLTWMHDLNQYNCNNHYIDSNNVLYSYTTPKVWQSYFIIVFYLIDSQKCNVQINNYMTRKVGSGERESSNLLIWPSSSDVGYNHSETVTHQLCGMNQIYNSRRERDTSDFIVYGEFYVPCTKKTSCSSSLWAYFWEW